MTSPAAKEELPTMPGSDPAKRAYEKPAVIELGDVRELTKGPGTGTHSDKNATRRPP